MSEDQFNAPSVRKDAGLFCLPAETQRSPRKAKLSAKAAEPLWPNKAAGKRLRVYFEQPKGLFLNTPRWDTHRIICKSQVRMAADRRLSSGQRKCSPLPSPKPKPSS